MAKRFGFTLAEVLITLGVIGVLAGMTIPTLMNNINDANYKTLYKKAFSVANNAFKQATADGIAYVPMSSQSDTISACTNWQIFSSQFKKSKVCTSGNANQCWEMTNGAEASNGTPGADVYAFIDASGMSWAMRRKCSGMDVYVDYFLVDTNGFKGPNKFGKDRWAFSWVLDNVTSGTPTKVSLYVNVDYTPGNTNAWVCPTGPCYYQSWLLN